MSYNKPEILNRLSALEVIEGLGNKPSGVHLDTDPSNVYFATYTSSVGAYEADE